MMLNCHDAIELNDDERRALALALLAHVTVETVEWEDVALLSEGEWERLCDEIDNVRGWLVRVAHLHHDDPEGLIVQVR